MALLDPTKLRRKASEILTFACADMPPSERNDSQRPIPTLSFSKRADWKVELRVDWRWDFAEKGGNNDGGRCEILIRFGLIDSGPSDQGESHPGLPCLDFGPHCLFNNRLPFSLLGGHVD